MVKIIEIEECFVVLIRFSVPWEADLTYLHCVQLITVPPAGLLRDHRFDTDNQYKVTTWETFLTSQVNDQMTFLTSQVNDQLKLS